jgi:hypothetical protein
MQSKEVAQAMYRGSNGWIRLAFALMALATISAFVGDAAAGRLRF